MTSDQTKTQFNKDASPKSTLPPSLVLVKYIEIMAKPDESNDFHLQHCFQASKEWLSNEDPILPQMRVGKIHELLRKFNYEIVKMITDTFFVFLRNSSKSYDCDIPGTFLVIRNLYASLEENRTQYNQKDLSRIACMKWEEWIEGNDVHLKMALKKDFRYLFDKCTNCSKPLDYQVPKWFPWKKKSEISFTSPTQSASSLISPITSVPPMSISAVEHNSKPKVSPQILISCNNIYTNLSVFIFLHAMIEKVIVSFFIYRASSARKFPKHQQL